LPRWHVDRGKKPTGGVVTQHRKKRKYEIGSQHLLVKIGTEKRFVKRVKGGKIKIKARSVEFVNVVNPKTKKVRKVKILDVVKTPSDPHLARRGIITKGTIIRTEIGLVTITSRPSQHGITNGILIKGKNNF